VSDDGLLVKIEYGAVENGNAARGGWLPAIWDNGRQIGDTWSGLSFDREQAEAFALVAAHNLSARCVGDYRTEIYARTAG
jgi:hypothetical protein